MITAGSPLAYSAIVLIAILVIIAWGLLYLKGACHQAKRRWGAQKSWPERRLACFDVSGSISPAMIKRMIRKSRRRRFDVFTYFSNEGGPVLVMNKASLNKMQSDLRNGYRGGTDYHALSKYVNNYRITLYTDMSYYDVPAIARLTCYEIVAIKERRHE